MSSLISSTPSQPHGDNSPPPLSQPVKSETTIASSAQSSTNSDSHSEPRAETTKPTLNQGKP